jgi:hypothetical protein
MHSRSSERLLIYHYKKMQTQLFGTGEAITWALLAISMRWWNKGTDVAMLRTHLNITFVFLQNEFCIPVSGIQCVYGAWGTREGATVEFSDYIWIVRCKVWMISTWIRGGDWRSGELAWCTFFYVPQTLIICAYVFLPMNAHTSYPTFERPSLRN